MLRPEPPPAPAPKTAGPPPQNAGRAEDYRAGPAEPRDGAQTSFKWVISNFGASTCWSANASR